MNFVQELVTALHVTVIVAQQRRFWVARARSLFSWPVLAALAVPASLMTIALTAMVPWQGARAVVAVFAMVLCAAIMLRAWCPLLARFAMGVLGIRLPELPLPSLRRFSA
ncbi:hypothetical protein [Massilia sp. TSP1-1-2]|uniref:hypothetical protein n=1 Tax=unclassified Massilia TaxID=2609279 RepID=UPI003CE677AD